MKTIPHISQAQLKSFQKLTQKKYREEEKKFLIEGIHLVEEALDSDWEIEVLLICPVVLSSKAESIEDRAADKGVEVYEITERELDKLSDTVTSQGIIGVLKTQIQSVKNLLKNLPKQSILVALEDVGDPGNTGTIIRTCDWFNAQGVLLNTTTAELYNPKVIRSSMGSIFHTPVVDDIDLLDSFKELRSNGYTIIATALENGTALSSYRFPEKSLLVFGNEARGVSNEILEKADEILTIPKFGKAESLNVSIACGVVLSASRFSTS